MINVDKAIQLWPYLTEEALKDEAYSAYIQKWLDRPTPGGKPMDILSWYTRQLTVLQDELRRQKEEQGNRPTTIEQSMNFALLPVNPSTGEVNPYALPLESVWILDAIMDKLLDDPRNRFIKTTILDSCQFEITTTEVRDRIGRKKEFSDQAQAEAFRRLVAWQIVSQYVWDESQNLGRGGWYPVKSEHGISAITEWDKTEEAYRGRRRSRYVFRGELHPLAWFIIRYNVMNHRILKLPKTAYRMSRGAQLLYRQGLPFIFSRTGWRLTYPVACRVLDYPEAPVKDQPGAIEKFVTEIVESIDWRRDKEREGREGGVGQHRIWVLKASKKAVRDLIMSREHHSKIDQARALKQSH